MTNVRYPILAALTPAIISTIVVAVANFLKAFGIAEITQDQIDSINGLGSLLILLLGGAGIAIGQNKTTPVAGPTLPEGTVVTVETPKGQENGKVTL